MTETKGPLFGEFFNILVDFKTFYFFLKNGYAFKSTV